MGLEFPNFHDNIAIIFIIVRNLYIYVRVWRGGVKSQDQDWFKYHKKSDYTKSSSGNSIETVIKRTFAY